MYIPVDREGSPLSKVLDMVNKFAKYQLLNADNVLDIKEELIKLKEDNIRRAKAECMACEDISSFQLERYLKNIDTKK